MTSSPRPGASGDRQANPPAAAGAVAGAPVASSHAPVAVPAAAPDAVTTASLEEAGRILAAAFGSPTATRIVRRSTRRLRSRDEQRWWAITTPEHTAVILAARSRPTKAWTLAVSLVAAPLLVVGMAWGFRTWAPLVGLLALAATGVLLRVTGGRPLLEAAANARFGNDVDWTGMQLGVIPSAQATGVGSRLLATAHQQLCARGESGLIVAKAGLGDWYESRARPVRGWPHVYIIGAAMKNTRLD